MSKKERREQRRLERDETLSRERQSGKIKKIGKWLLPLLITAAVVGGFFYFSRRKEPASNDLSQGYPIVSRDHVARGVGVTDYNSNPPTSGKHWSDASAPISRGVHDEEFPDEALVHNLEHGEVWISYRSNIPDSVKEELRQIARDNYKTVLTLREKNDTDIALAAWGRLDKFNLDDKPLDKTRIEDFIKRYRNKGPELVP